jgi:hypothetical protein
MPKYKKKTEETESRSKQNWDAPPKHSKWGEKA